MRRRPVTITSLGLLAVLTALALWFLVSAVYMVAFIYSWWVYL